MLCYPKLFGQQCVRWPCQVAVHAVAFLRCRALACPALLALYVAIGSLRGHQDTRTPLNAALAANAVNLALDVLLMFGLRLGVAGVRPCTGSAPWMRPLTRHSSSWFDSVF